MGKPRFYSLRRSLRLRMIQYAAKVQADDEGLWSVPAEGTQSITEAHLQQALRDLHRVIEEGDQAALSRIEESAKI